MGQILAAYLQKLRSRLEAAGVENPGLDARLLVQHVLGFSPEDMISARDLTLSESQIQEIDSLIGRRIAREPVSRILGAREFWGMTFFLSKETLDPRPDSETLIETAAEILGDRKNETLRFLDLGTGTGCLLLSLLSEFPAATGTGIDISRDAAYTAEKNAKNLGFENRAEFLSASWNDFPQEKKYDLVVSNPPYIPDDEVSRLAPEVSRFDPHCALAGGSDGLDCYRRIAVLAPGFLVSGGGLILETGWNQAGDVSEILRLAGFRDMQIRKDLSGHNRCVFARF